MTQTQGALILAAIVAVVLAVATVWQYLKHEPFDVGAFFMRVVISWVVLVALAILLFLGWCAIAFNI